MNKFLILVFCLLQVQAFSQPVISTFSPSSGPVGSVVTIAGSGFSSTINNNVVYFGPVRATVSAASPTSLTVTVPVGASYKPITVTTSGLTGYYRKPFVVTFPGGGVITTNSFAPRLDFDITPNNAGFMASTDLDNDGRPEILTSSILSNGGSPVIRNISIAKNNSTPGSLLFATPINFLNPGISYSMDFGDINGDGKTDVIVPNYAFNENLPQVVVFINSSANGIISLASPVSFTSGGGYGIAVSDFDLDGLPDIASSNNDQYNPIVSFHRNTSFGGIVSFATKIDLSFGVNPRGITTGFINDDNKPDLIVANQYGSSISVYINTSTPGNISFSSLPNLSTTPGSYCEQVVVGDFDGDDKADIAVTNNNNSSIGTISVFKNTSAGGVSFAPNVDFTTGYNWGPYAINISDMDGDGKPDMVVSNQIASSAISVFRNNSTVGAISFEPKVDFNGLQPSRYVVANDLDNDGKPEITTATGLTYSIFRNTVDKPNITSISPADACAGTTINITGTNFTGATAVSFGGVPATSFSVISSTNISAVVGNGASGMVSVTTAVGTGTANGFTYTGPCVLSPIINSFTPTSASQGTLVTITGQNFSTTPSGNVVYFGAVKAAVSASTSTTLSVIVPSGATNRPITVTTNNLTAHSSKPFTLTFTEGDSCEEFSSSSFAKKQDFFAGGGPYSVTIADIDGNNKTDVFIANSSSNNISTLRNISSLNFNAFASTENHNVGTQPLGICYGDIDGDGKQDLAAVNYASNTVSVFRNMSSEGVIYYAPKIDFVTGSNPRNIFIQDINADGKPEIMVSNFGSNTFSVLRNTSSGTGVISFASQISFATGNGPAGIFVLDMDGDNKADLAVTNLQSNSVSIFRNTSLNSSTISFDPKIDFATGSQPVSIFVNDLDNDSKPDIVVSNNGSSTVSILRNLSSEGNLLFASKIDIVTGQGPFSVTVADLNGDNKPDIATSNVFDGTVSVLRNTSTTGAVNFASKIDYSSGNGPRSISAGDIDGDGRPDLITANSVDNTVSVLRNTFAVLPGQLCAGGTTSISSNLTGANFQWQVDVGAGFQNITDNSNYAGTNTKILTLNSVPTSWHGYQYRCVTDAAYSDTTKITFVSKWLGSIDSNWENPGNWSCNQVPDENTDVIINCGRTVELNSNRSCRSLTLKQNTLLTVKPGVTLTITH